MKRNDPLDQKITRTLETVAAEVPVRDRLAEFAASRSLSRARLWRLADNPALVGVAAFVVGITLVGGVLIALRGATNDPAGPSDAVSTAATTPDGLWLMSMNDCEGDCEEPAVMFGDAAYVASCDAIDESVLGDPIAVADPDSLIAVPYEFARPIAELNIDQAVALGPNAPAWCDETLGDWWAARSIDFLYDESLNEAIASYSPNLDPTAQAPPSTTSATTTPAIVDIPPIGDAYLVAIQLICGEMCPDAGAWISVSPNHSDYDDALAAISLAYPEARIVDHDAADGYPWTGNVLNIARIDDRSNPAVITLEVGFDADRRSPLPCAQVFLAATEAGSWEPAHPADVSTQNPVATTYQGHECARYWSGS